MKRWSRVVALAACSASAACEAPGELGLDTAVHAIFTDPFEAGCDDDLPGITCYGSRQSRALQGTRDPGLEGSSFSASSASWWVQGPDGDLELGPPKGTVSADAAGLAIHADQTRLPDELLLRITFAATGGDAPPHDVRIKTLLPLDAQHRRRYLVEYRHDGGAWSLLCAPDDFAYVVPGQFTADGMLVQEDDDELSFACGRGAAAKVIGWGYGPWGGLEDFFLAGTRVARADYPGIGKSYTLNGTNVLVYNLDGVGENWLPDVSLSGPSESAPYFFEAAWRADRNAAAICLTKYRWQAIRPGGFAGDLPDPRVSQVGPSPSHEGAFCDDLGEFDTLSFEDGLAKLHELGALVFSSSQQNDTGLWVWKATTGAQKYLTTPRGFWAGAALSTILPEPGYEIAFGEDSYVANIHTREQGEGTVELFEYFNATTNEFRTTTKDLDEEPSWILVGSAGFVYTDAASVPAPLRAVPLLTRTSFVWTQSGFRTRRILLADHNPAPSGKWSKGTIEGYGFVMP